MEAIQDLQPLGLKAATKQTEIEGKLERLFAFQDITEQKLSAIGEALKILSDRQRPIVPPDPAPVVSNAFNETLSMLTKLRDYDRKVEEGIEARHRAAFEQYQRIQQAAEAGMPEAEEPQEGAPAATPEDRVMNVFIDLLTKGKGGGGSAASSAAVAPTAAAPPRQLRLSDGQVEQAAAFVPQDRKDAIKAGTLSLEQAKNDVRAELRNKGMPDVTDDSIERLYNMFRGPPAPPEPPQPPKTGTGPVDDIE